MRESLFDDDEFYTETTNELVQDVRTALKPVLKKWVEDNYKVRDIEYVIIDEVTIMGCEARLRIGYTGE